MFDINIVIGIGNNSAISASKIRKLTANWKNRDENGSGADFFVSNPNSNGDPFSLSSLIFFEIRVVKIIIATIAVGVIIIISIYLVFTNFLIGSEVYISYVR